jgi:hypothetical protein
MGRGKMMGWPIFEPENSGEIHKVPITTLYRWYLYDTVGEDANKNIEVFGLSPVSNEGHEKEQEDSDHRILAINALIPFLTIYANMNAEFSFEAHRKEMLKIPGIDESVLNSGANSLKEFYSNLAFNAMLASTAAAVELNLIKMYGMYTGIKEGNDE